VNDVPVWGWVAFSVVLLVLLVIDISVHRGGKDSRREAIWWSIIWIGAGLAFALIVWGLFDFRATQEYLAAYLIEKSLSLDNLFVFLIIFRTLRIPQRYQRVALSWGIFGALVFRAIFVFAGAAALERWGWVEYVFALILLVAAIHTFRETPSEEEESRLVLLLSRYLPVSSHRDTPHFIEKREGKWMATPLLVAVIGLELTDVLFAIDSVPAALSITRNEFIVYSSNAFAILGLRSLYLVLAHTIAQLRYLHYGLSAVLAFAAFKMLSDRWIHISPGMSILVITILIGGSVWASQRARRGEQATSERAATGRTAD
jgi:tellurite resistance protein TerC